MAAARYATLVVNMGGSNINVDMYISDIANAKANFASGGVSSSTSETFWKAPSAGVIVDFSVATGLTDTTAGQVVINNAPTMSIIRWANHLNSLNNRPALNIPFNKDELIGILQLA